MNISYFASPQIAVETLEALINDPEINVKLIITQADKKSGRGNKIQNSAIKNIALSHDIPLLQPEKSNEIFAELSKYELDFNIVFAFGMILKSDVLNHPKYGSINIHASILPKYRGASPINEAILQGDTESGISIMKMDEKMDHGNIIKILKIKIDEKDSTSDLSSKISKISSENLPQILKDYKNGKLQETVQDHEQASYCKKHEDSDAEINLNKDSNTVLNQIRAFDSNPKAFFKHKNGKKIIIHKAEQTEEKINPGEFKIINKELIIGTSSTAIKVLELTLEGKKRMNIKEFLNGYQSLF